MSSPAPRDLSQDTLFFLFRSLLLLLESKGVVTSEEFAAFLSEQSTQSKTEHPPTYAPSTLSEANRVAAWFVGRLESQAKHR